MRFYKLRVTPNAANLASTFNTAFQPEIIPEHNDPFQVEWFDESCSEDVLVGEKYAHFRFHIPLFLFCGRPFG